MRMSMRSFTRPRMDSQRRLRTARRLSPHYMHYNFAGIHKTLHFTPATEAGVATHVWSVDEIGPART